MPEPHRNGLILLFGLPRSGTTWIGKIFDSHPATLYRHEPDSQGRLSTLPLLPGDAPDIDASREIDRFVTGLPELCDLKTAGSMPVFKKDWVSEGGTRLYACGIWAARFLSRLGGSERVWFAPGDRLPPDVTVVWKSIESLARLGWILSVCPYATPIHVIRHPCGHIASVLEGERRRKFSSECPAADDRGLLELLANTTYAKSRGIGIQELQSMTAEERLAWRWLIFNEAGIDAVEASGRGGVFSYDALCADAERLGGKMLRAAGLELSPQVDEFVRASTGGSGRSSYYSVYRNAGEAAERWRQVLSVEQADRIMTVVKNSRSVGYFAS